ncbi:ABC transporter ATP-binding protein [uncultured Microbulbifer sp.]|uniref:ABC transporter ATP-binding protein n=1 Tax=uncultured Microbulbifer sp. TaxID=348147 RepID=UPI0025D513DD|nr:ABC transporter ATP-binding protein [uncultured Microbulbifer sp.]
MTDAAPSAVPALEVEGIRKIYRLGEVEIRALDDVSLQVAPGSFVAVMGPSGSGKSTLLHLMGLLDAPDAGVVRIRGTDTGGLDDDALTALRRDEIGFVFQTFELIPNLSARENALLPAEVAGRLEPAQARLATLGARLGIADRLDHRPAQLSGGQRQRVALARALVVEPAILFADEPTGNLDATTGEQIVDLMFSLHRERGTTLVMVTHDLALAERSGRVIAMRDGEIDGASVHHTQIAAQ